MESIQERPSQVILAHPDLGPFAHAASYKRFKFQQSSQGGRRGERSRNKLTSMTLPVPCRQWEGIYLNIVVSFPGKRKNKVKGVDIKDIARSPRESYENRN